MRSSRLALIVASDPHTAAALEEMLHFFGFETRTASTAEEAVRFTSEFRLAVAMIDITSPALSGGELAVRLRAEPLLHDCKFVALTHKFGRRHAQCSLNEFDALLVKPVSLETLLATLVSCGSAVLA